MVDVAVEQQPESEQFVARSGDQVAALTRYVERQSWRVFVHTETADAYAGQGVASTLVRTALEITRDQGRRVVAVCPFVAAFVRRHPEFDDLVDDISVLGTRHDRS